MIVRFAILALMITVAAGAWFTVGPGSGAPTGACTSAASASGSPSETANVPATVQWEAASVPEELRDGGEQVMLDAVTFGGGFVAVGRESNGPESHAFTLRSSDGRAWEGNPDDEARFAGAEIHSLVKVGDRLVGIGSAATDDRGGSRAAVWLSDDGTSWHAATGPFDDAYTTSVAADGEGILLIGGRSAGGVLRMWSSDDGEVWQDLPVELPVPLSEAQFGPVAAVTGGWLSLGTVSRGVDAPAAPVAWRSNDGVRWSCHLLDGAGFPVAQPNQLHRSGPQWLVIGVAAELCGFAASCVGYPIGWTSSDGLTWSRATIDEEPINVGGTAYDGSEAGFLAVGHGATWRSADGDTWVRASDDETGGELAGQPETLLLASDDRIVVTGTTYDGASDGDPWIAVGELSP